MAIASPTAAPRKRERRDQIFVICRVYARRRDGCNSTLGVKKGKPTHPTVPFCAVEEEEEEEKGENEEAARRLQTTLSELN